GRLDRARQRLLTCPPDLAAGLEETVRRMQAEHALALAVLKEAEEADPLGDLEEEGRAAEQLLWELEEHTTDEDAQALREALGEVIERVELRFTSRTGKGGRTRSRLVGGTVIPKAQGASPTAFRSG